MRTEISICTEILKQGKTLLYPTDTVWGIGCDATNRVAVEKIISIKRRPESKSLIILLDRADNLSRYVTEVPEIAYDLIENVDTPLTIIYPKAKNLAENVIAEDGSIAIRIVKPGIFCHEMIRAFRKPIVSTSANVSGTETPMTYRFIQPEITRIVDHTVPQSFETPGTVKPSQIIKLSVNGEFTIIRK
jgi:L-threonylcarbamoyladenylate synthase